MKREKEYFEITIEELKSLAKWASDYSEQALHIYDEYRPSDGRPRAAIHAAREFSTSGKRTNLLRKFAMDAYRAATKANDPAASSAARSASLAAATAFTHPFKDINQAKHILGPVVLSALAQELYKCEDHQIGNNVISKAVLTAPLEVIILLRKMPRQPIGKNRLDALYHQLDLGIAEQEIDQLRL